MTLFLGIDGGGSGCRAAIADASGRVLGHGAAGPANAWSDPEGARRNLLAAAASALEDSGAGAGLGDLHAVLGLAGANVPRVGAHLAEELPFALCRIESDAVIAVRGALGRDDGVVAALGTGAVYGVQRAGSIRTIGGWGFVFGDQGSGARIGRALLEDALLAHDGVLPTTPLLAEVIAGAGGPGELVAEARDATPADFAARVPAVIAAAELGDAAALRILADAEADVIRSIDALRDASTLPVCFLGGIGRGHYALRLAGRYGAAIRPPAGSALDGALALARELE
jgi:glucosamine kinase